MSTHKHSIPEPTAFLALPRWISSGRAWVNVRVLRRELVTALAVCLAAHCLPALGNAVPHVIGSRPEKQMIRIHARSVVAAMTDIDIARGHGAMQQFPKDARDDSQSSIMPHVSVAAGVARALPRPARVGTAATVRARKYEFRSDDPFSTLAPSSIGSSASLLGRPCLGRASSGGPSEFSECDSMRIFHMNDNALSLAHYQGGIHG